MYVEQVYSVKVLLLKKKKEKKEKKKKKHVYLHFQKKSIQNTKVSSVEPITKGEASVFLHTSEEVR